MTEDPPPFPRPLPDTDTQPPRGPAGKPDGPEDEVGSPAASGRLEAEIGKIKAKAGQEGRDLTAVEKRLIAALERQARIEDQLAGHREAVRALRAAFDEEARKRGWEIDAGLGAALREAMGDLSAGEILALIAAGKLKGDGP